MSFLDDLVTVQITANTATPSKPGFGTILIAAQKVPAAFVNRVRKFGSLKEMTDFGFLVTDPAYIAASKIKAQNPSLTSWKVGRRALKTTQSCTLKCLSAVEGDTYSANINGQAITYTVPAAATTTSVAAAIELLIEALTGVDSSAASDTITVTATAGAGTLLNYKSLSSNFEFKDASADPGIATDLAAIEAEDADWYGLVLDSQSQAEIEAASPWVESAKKFWIWNSSDTLCADAATTTDVFSTQQDAGYARSGGLYSKAELLSYSCAALTAKEFVENPGAATLHLKRLASVTVDSLTAGQASAIKDKNGTVYVTVSGLNVTMGGKTASGEWFDTTRFVDWQKAEIQFRVFSYLVNNKKVPYTDLGIDGVVAQIDGALDKGVERGGLVRGTTAVSAPLAEDVDAGVRGLRRLEDVRFSGRLAGAIHELDIQGEVTN